MQDRLFNIGDMIICFESGVIGKAVRFYYPTSCGEQTVVTTLDGNQYHAPTNTWALYSDKFGGMMSGKTMTMVATELANGIYLRRCDDLEGALTQCFQESFIGEHISNERMERIYDKFCTLLLGEEESV